MNFLYSLYLKINSNIIVRQVRKLSFELRILLNAEPKLWFLYRIYIWWGKLKIKAIGKIDPHEREITESTELVIDGYPGSANSYAVRLFKYINKKPVKLAHHLHSPAQIIQAISKKIPVIVTIREPRSAVLSVISRVPHVSISQALRRYIRFYNKLLPYTEYFVITDFKRTISEFNLVINEVNKRFEASFFVYNPDEIDFSKIRSPKKHLSEKSLERKKIKEKKEPEFELAKCQVLLKKANDTYNNFLILGEKNKISE